MLPTHLSLREERTSCLSSGIASSGPLLHPLLESFASMTSHLLSSLPLYINRPIPGKHLQTITTSPLTTHFYKNPLPGLQFTSPASFGYIPFSILSCLVQFWNVSSVLILIFQQDYKLHEGRDHALFCFHIPSKTYHNASCPELRSFERLWTEDLDIMSGRIFGKKVILSVGRGQADSGSPEAKRHIRKSVYAFPVGKWNRLKCSAGVVWAGVIPFLEPSRRGNKSWLENILFYIIAMRSHFCRNQEIIELLSAECSFCERLMAA